MVASTGLCMFLILSVWATVRVVDWASDLPNRIDIQVDGESVAWFIAVSARETLKQGAYDRQLECLKALADGIKTNPEVVPWIQAELKLEIETLLKSPNPRVTAMADEVYSKLPTSENTETGA